jgi:hypothetical protein
MIVNFVGNYQNGYIGEVSDETHIVREIEAAGHTVRKIPRDEWREFVRESCPKGKFSHVPENLKADINIFAKWHHFYDGSFIDKLRELSGAPVFLWVWDYMYSGGGVPDWHWKQVDSCDLYLSNEAGVSQFLYKHKFHYFPFDVCDGDIKTFTGSDLKGPKYDVTFLGSHLDQGDRVPWLKEINKVHKVTIFSWNHEDWIADGFEAYPPVWGEEFNKVVANSGVVLGFSVDANCWGYWSNRVGKVIKAGGCLLQQYSPGMELMIGDLVDYFGSVEEAIEKIAKYKSNPAYKTTYIYRCRDFGYRFSSKERVKQLMILCERYLKGDPSKWNKLP